MGIREVPVIRPPGRTRRTIEGSIAWMRMQKACRKQGGRTGDQGTRCETVLTQVETCNDGREEVCSQMCQRALTRKRTLCMWGGALQVGDLSLLEDGGERGGALVSDPVPSETASEGRSGNGVRASVSTGADTKANTRELVRAPGGLLE